MSERAGFTTIALLVERLLGEVQGLRADLAAARRAPPTSGGAAEPEGLLTAKQAGVLLGMSESWIYQRTEAGELPCVRLGHSVRFVPAALRAYARGERPATGRVLALPRRPGP